MRMTMATTTTTLLERSGHSRTLLLRPGPRGGSISVTTPVDGRRQQQQQLEQRQFSASVLTEEGRGRGLSSSPTTSMKQQPQRASLLKRMPSLSPPLPKMESCQKSKAMRSLFVYNDDDDDTEEEEECHYEEEEEEEEYQQTEEEEGHSMMIATKTETRRPSLILYKTTKAFRDLISAAEAEARAESRVEADKRRRPILGLYKTTKAFRDLMAAAAAEQCPLSGPASDSDIYADNNNKQTKKKLNAMVERTSDNRRRVRFCLEANDDPTNAATAASSLTQQLFLTQDEINAIWYSRSELRNIQVASMLSATSIQADMSRSTLIELYRYVCGIDGGGGTTTTKRQQYTNNRDHDEDINPNHFVEQDTDDETITTTSEEDDSSECSSSSSSSSTTAVAAAAVPLLTTQEQCTQLSGSDTRGLELIVNPALKYDRQCVVRCVLRTQDKLKLLAHQQEQQDQQQEEILAAISQCLSIQSIKLAHIYAIGDERIARMLCFGDDYF